MLVTHGKSVSFRCLTNFRLGVGRSAPHSSATPLYLHPVDGLVHFILLCPRQISRASTGAEDRRSETTSGRRAAQTDRTTVDARLVCGDS